MRKIIIAMIFIFTLSGCGQSGKLYLPVKPCNPTPIEGNYYGAHKR